MLTIFSTPKPFEGQINIIQRNAIQSWMRLSPAAEIILCGNERGTKEIASEFNLIHLPCIKTNQFGTPLLDSLFEQAQAKASNDIMCYVNADILLMNDLVSTIRMAKESLGKTQFMIVGLRWNFDIDKEWDFKEGDSDKKLHDFAVTNGAIHHMGTDYYAFTKGSLGQLKPFAIGRYFWDGWLLYHAKSEGVNVIDATGQISAFHQNHFEKRGAKSIKKKYVLSVEEAINKKLCGWYPASVTILDSDYIMTSGELKKPGIDRKFKKLIQAAISWTYALLYEAYPYSHPLLWLGGVVYRATIKIRTKEIGSGI